jgi:hypothetical protein
MGIIWVSLPTEKASLSPSPGNAPAEEMDHQTACLQFQALPARATLAADGAWDGAARHFRHPIRAKATPGWSRSGHHRRASWIGVAFQPRPKVFKKNEAVFRGKRLHAETKRLHVKRYDSAVTLGRGDLRCGRENL